jgi:hypothetical protein
MPTGRFARVTVRAVRVRPSRLAHSPPDHLSAVRAYFHHGQTCHRMQWVRATWRFRQRCALVCVGLACLAVPSRGADTLEYSNGNLPGVRVRVSASTAVLAGIRCTLVGINATGRPFHSLRALTIVAVRARRVRAPKRVRCARWQTACTVNTQRSRSCATHNLLQRAVIFRGFTVVSPENGQPSLSRGCASARIRAINTVGTSPTILTRTGHTRRSASWRRRRRLASLARLRTQDLQSCASWQCRAETGYNRRHLLSRPRETRSGPCCRGIAKHC